MSLVPHHFGRNFWDVCDFPERLFGQHFGHGMDVDDLLHLRPLRYQLSVPPTDLQRYGFSKVTNDKDGFHVQMDCSHFSPEELTVKMVDGSIVVHGKHEEKQDKHGFITREFTRRYVIPENVIVEQINSSLDAHGVLTINAPPKPKLLKGPGNETIIPIQISKRAAIKDGSEQNKYGDQEDGKLENSEGTMPL